MHNDFPQIEFLLLESRNLHCGGDSQSLNWSGFKVTLTREDSGWRMGRPPPTRHSIWAAWGAGVSGQAEVLSAPLDVLELEAVDPDTVAKIRT